MTDHDTVTRAYRRDGVTVMFRVERAVPHNPSVTGRALGLSEGPDDKR
jgi:hypothetical protein